MVEMNKSLAPKGRWDGLCAVHVLGNVGSTRLLCCFWQEEEKAVRAERPGSKGKWVHLGYTAIANKSKKKLKWVMGIMVLTHSRCLVNLVPSSSAWCEWKTHGMFCRGKMEEQCSDRPWAVCDHTRNSWNGFRSSSLLLIFKEGNPLHEKKKLFLQSVLWILWVRSEPSVVGDFLSTLSEENKRSDRSSGRWRGAGAACSPACFCALHSLCVPWEKSSAGEGILGCFLCLKSLSWRYFVVICA